MKKIIYRILPVVAMLLVVAPAMVSRDKAVVSESDKRKAAYYFLEAQNEKSHDRNDAFYDLVKRAHELDPTNSTYSFYVGHGLFTRDGATREDGSRAVELMKEHFEACPDDYYETIYYSDACMMLGNAGDGLRAIESLTKHYPYRIELMVRLADAQARVGDYKASNATYDSIMALHGTSQAVITAKLSNYVTMNDTTGALNQMRSLLATAPENSEYNVVMGSLMQQFGKADSAIYYLDRAQKVDPTNGYIYLAKAQYYKLNGDSTQYKQQLRQALVNENLDIDNKMQLLMTTLQQLTIEKDSTGQADSLFVTLIDQHPHEAKVHEMYSEYLAYKRNWHGAAEQMQYSLDINPTDADGWQRMMILQMMDEDYPAALKSADKALEYNPDSVSLLRYIAPAYYQMKQYDKALETYSKALALCDTLDVETRSDMLGGMGDVYQELKQPEKAYECYDKSIELNPANVGIMNNYAYFLSLDGKDLDKAERMAALAVKAYPKSSTYLDTYAWVFYKKKDYKMALVYIKSAVENDDEKSADVLDHYGDILFMNGESEAALEQWKLALEKAPENELIKKKVKFKTIFSE